VTTAVIVLSLSATADIDLCQTSSLTDIELRSFITAYGRLVQVSEL